MSAIVEPSRSSTPAVAPAMMSRGDFSRPARCAASVSAFTLNSSPSRDAPMLDDHRHVALPAQVDEQRRACPCRRARRRGQDRPSRRSSTCAAAAAFTRPTPASAPVRPTAGTPAAPSAATNRVFTSPASTLTTTSSVGSSVMRSPSTCRFSMPTRASDASISRPPPCTMTSGCLAGEPGRSSLPALRRAADPRAARRRTSGRPASSLVSG